MRAAARARSNIALIKYWGKADVVLNVPAVGSISITLDGLWSDTEVEFDSALDDDELLLDGRKRPEQLAKVSACLDVVRRIAGVETRATVVSSNNFPTGAGLASSASGFAALAKAAVTALGLDLSDRDLSIIARQGSGSAARSVFGGFVEMHAGVAEDGSDSFAEPLLEPNEWPLEVVVAITATAEKKVGSTSGMTLSAQTSPYYPIWVQTHSADMAIARDAVNRRDFTGLAEVSEYSCLKMHAAAIAARPALIYWNAATVEGIQRIWQMRNSGVPVFFTVDAGPQIKAICEPDARSTVQASLEDLPGVIDVRVMRLGPGVESR